MSIESVMPSNHLILCNPLLLPSISPSIRVFSNKSALCIRWPNYWSFSCSISPSNEYSGLISIRIDWFDTSSHFLMIFSTMISKAKCFVCETNNTHNELETWKWKENRDQMKRPWCWERLKMEGKGNNRGWDDWIASLPLWTWVWTSSGSLWWMGKPGVLQIMRSQRVGHDWATELNCSQKVISTTMFEKLSCTLALLLEMLWKNCIRLTGKANDEHHQWKAQCKTLIPSSPQLLAKEIPLQIPSESLSQALLLFLSRNYQKLC